ncbi:MAG TPA: hypothetical protein P5069_03610, partial [Candidatus Hydrogenedentes bacterium]|nr:hypothetical protein [Candidatus Hydrogenedentota bacterium]
DINPAQDLPVQWDATTPGDGIYLTLSSGLWNETDQSYTAGSVSCTLVDDGSHVVPASLLSQLPVNPQQGIGLTIVRMNRTQAQVPLTRGGNGWVILRGESTYFASGKPSWVDNPLVK